jgi:hypothetical protein
MNRQGFGVLVACPLDRGVPYLDENGDLTADSKLMAIASYLCANQCDFEALYIFTQIHVHGLIHLVL